MFEQLINKISSSKKTLWILCGLPYSGKTYISSKIINSTSIVYISIDNILEEIGFDWDLGNLPDESGWKKVFDISYEKSEKALRSNLNVLYDSTNHTKASRDALRKVAEKVNAKTRIIFITVPIEIIWERWSQNLLQKNRSVIAKDLVETTIKSFEIPADSENVFQIENIGL